MKKRSRILSERERAIRQRLKADFAHYASHCLKIRTKAGAVEPFVLNAAQRHIDSELARQLAESGRVRALILKGRQQGCSTYVEGRYFWRVTHNRGTRAFILTHLDEATMNLFEMAKRFYAHCPALVRPRLKASNARELVFDRLDSGYRIGTAGSRGAGRSQTIQYFHGSEVAYWPNAEEHVAGALQAVPNAAGTEVILESTSAGRRGLFWEMCERAQHGHGEHRLIFVPWFWQAEYREEAAEGFAASAEEEDYGARHGLAATQLAWRRAKIAELGGLHHFRREYPATPEEAFSAERPGSLWRRELIHGARVAAAPPLKRIVVAIDPSGGEGERSDEVGIVAAGLGHDGHGYVLEDLSGRMGPAAWGRRAVAAYHRLEADRIVAEKNFGGEMVAHVIHTVDHAAPLKLVTASRGKELRAEPIAALYEQGKVHHVGTHLALEDEMTSWEPLAAGRSPNRVDALVWALSELMIEPAAPRLVFG
ncbi:MAG: hypothetical protein ACHQRJ_10700 [Alphaproteobacteria bacterium]